MDAYADAELSSAEEVEIEEQPPTVFFADTEPQIHEELGGVEAEDQKPENVEGEYIVYHCFSIDSVQFSVSISHISAVFGPNF